MIFGKMICSVIGHPTEKCNVVDQYYSKVGRCLEVEVKVLECQRCGTRFVRKNMVVDTNKMRKVLDGNNSNSNDSGLPNVPCLRIHSAEEGSESKPRKASKKRAQSNQNADVLGGDA